MQRAADQRRAPRALLAALLAAVVAVLSLLAVPPHAAQAQDGGCSLLDPDYAECLDTTSTTEDEDLTTTTEDPEPEETTTTERRQTATTEEVTTSTITITTLHDVLIPGDGTAGAETTTSTAPDTVTGSSGISDETLIMAIVGALGLLGVVIGVLTYRYWAATRPQVVEAPPARGSGRSVFTD